MGIDNFVRNKIGRAQHAWKADTMDGICQPTFSYFIRGFENLSVDFRQSFAPNLKQEIWSG